MTRGEFAKRVLEGIGAPLTTHTRRAMQAWLQAEGGSADFNPLNTTLHMPNSRTLPGNIAGVQEYRSIDDGVTATIRTLKENAHGYPKIRRRLRLNAPAWATLDAIIESDWGTGHEDAPGRDTVLEQVLDDIQHDRRPNTLGELEARRVAS
jgi:hypothetical protein